ncbi:MAG: hypothetical protein ACK4HW_12630, partial [Roseinatronobacter sp.]
LACEDGSAWPHPVPNVPQNRSCHEQGRSPRGNVIIRDGTPSDEWGLVIELLIEAFSLSAFSADKVCLIEHFSAAFSQKSGFPFGYSPFTMPNYEDNFDQEKMRQMYEKTRMRKSPRSSTTPD